MATKSFFLIISVVLLNSNMISSSEMITSSPTPMDTCKTQLDLCSLETGKSHFIGAPGAKGLKGERGDDGPMGPPGIDGSKGSAGIDGRNGVDGPPGVEGDKGSTGLSGVRGAKGNQGAPGLPGPKGPKGNKASGTRQDQSKEPKHDGVAGANATCGCKSDIGIDYRDVDERREWGAENNVALVTCRDAPEKAKKTKKDKYWIFFGAMEVSCDFDAGTTCVLFDNINRENPIKTITYKESKSFWLSEKEVSLEDIYNLHSDVLTWLQRQSYTANLTLRYHCMNSTPKNLTLLAWNDMKIGPKSSSSSPFYYTLENDGCSGAKKDKWNYTDIVLKSFRAQMLPIIDFFIEDVTNEEQAIRIETVKLCFG